MESTYLILRRERMLGIKSPEEKKQQKPIAKRSGKMKTEMKKYLPEMKAFLALNPDCQIKMKGCTGKAVCVHHTAGRTGHKLHDQEDWLVSCLPCNLTVETSDLEAREKGFKKSRIKVS